MVVELPRENQEVARLKRLRELREARRSSIVGRRPRINHCWFPVTKKQLFRDVWKAEDVGSDGAVRRFAIAHDT